MRHATARLFSIIATIIIIACGTAVYQYNDDDGTLYVENGSTVPYTIRYRGMRLGSVYPGMKECFSVRWPQVGFDVIQLDPLAGEPFYSYPFVPGTGENWSIDINESTSFMEGVSVVFEQEGC